MDDSARMKLFLESLGCARNLVDSEVMLGRLRQAGFDLTREAAEAEIIVVNTCSFIRAAADESIDTILELARLKASGRCRRLIGPISRLPRAAADTAPSASSPSCAAGRRAGPWRPFSPRPGR